MSDEAKLTSAIVGWVAMVLITLIICQHLYYYRSEEMFISKGYTRTVLPGSQSPVWVKEIK